MQNGNGLIDDSIYKIVPWLPRKYQNSRRLKMGTATKHPININIHSSKLGTPVFACLLASIRSKDSSGHAFPVIQHENISQPSHSRFEAVT